MDSTLFPLYNSTSRTQPNQNTHPANFQSFSFGPAPSYNNMSTLSSAFNHPIYSSDSDNESQMPSSYNHMSMPTSKSDLATLKDHAGSSDSDSASETLMPVCWPSVCMLCPLYLASREKLYEHFQLVHDGKSCGRSHVGGAMEFQSEGEYDLEAHARRDYKDGMDEDDYPEALAFETDDESLADDCSEGYPLTESDYSDDILEASTAEGSADESSNTLSGPSPASEDMEDLVLDDFNDLWNDNFDAEACTVMARICSVCSFFATTQVELYYHFENDHPSDSSTSSACEDESENELDEEMSDAMDLDDNAANDENSDDAETVTPQNVQPCTNVDCERTRSEKLQNLRVWLSGLGKDDTGPFVQDEAPAHEENLRIPTQMVFFRPTEGDQRDFMCGYCDKEFEFEGELHVHLESDHAQTPSAQIHVQKQQQQPMMNLFSYSNLIVPAEHIQHICDTDNLPEEWPVEEEVETSREGTQDDIPTPANSGYADHSCDFCMAEFGDSDALLYHMLCIHSLDVVNY